MTDTNLIYPYEFKGGRKAVASEVNANFEAVKTFANGINVSLNEMHQAISDLKNKPTREMFDVFYSFSSLTPTGAYPLWTGETISHCKSLYPQFWNKVKNLAATGNLSLFTSEDEYKEKLETYGQCASFYMDELNGHLRLPKIVKFISSLDDITELAKEENAGLPNIKGYLRPYRMGEPSGAFYNSAKSDFNHTSAKTGSSSHAQKSTMFDASLSNKIYGASQTVQPPAVKLCLYIQVANNVGEISEFDTKALAKELEEALISLENAYEKHAAQLQTFYESVKEDILNASTIVKDEEIDVGVNMFVYDGEYEEFPYAAQVLIEDANADMIPIVIFSLKDALSSNFAPIAQSFNGYIKIFAKEIPLEDVKIASIVLQ